MNRKAWESKFIEVITNKGLSVPFAKFLSKIVPHCENNITPEKAAEIEFTKLYK